MGDDDGTNFVDEEEAELREDVLMLFPGKYTPRI